METERQDMGESDGVGTATALVLAEAGKPEPAPRPALTSKQREAARLIVAEDLTNVALAERLHVSVRTVYNWRCKSAFKAYLLELVDAALAETQQAIRAFYARKGLDYAKRLGELGEGKGRKGRPRHPYQVDALKALQERLLGKAASAQPVSVGAEIPTDHGPIRIFFKARE